MRIREANPEGGWFMSPDGAEATTHQKRSFRKSSRFQPRETEEVARWAKYPPREYKNRYPALDAYRPGSNLRTLFGDGVGRHDVPLVTHRGFPVFGEIRSDTPECINYLRELSHVLNKELPVDLDSEKMFTTTGVHSTFDRTRCVAGYHQTPMNIKIVRNGALRKAMGLSEGYTPRQLAIAREFWDLAWSHAKVGPVNVTKNSAGGIRRFSKSHQWKLDFAQWLLLTENFERMLNAVDKEDWLTLANEFEMVFMMYIQKRVQVDSVDKIRYANDLLYALTSGEEGQRRATDKKVVISGVDTSDFSALRVRVVDAGPWVINLFLQICATGCMHGLFHRYPDTFHVNTDEDIERVCNGREVYCSDVSEYDQSMSKDALEVVFDRQREKWDERIVKAARRLYCSPYYSRPVTVDGSEGFFVGDPTKWDVEMWGGNRSGHAYTSLIAKGNKVVESLFIIDTMYPVLGRVEQFLLHRMPIKLVNNGDDEIALFDTTADYLRFKQLRTNKALGHYDVAPETGQGFSGRLICKIGPRRYKCRPKLQTPVERLWIPEHPWGSFLNQNPGIGAMVRVNDLAAHDAGRVVLDAMTMLYRKHFRGYTDFMRTIMLSLEQSQFAFDSYSVKDREVAADPKKIHYKYTPDEIDPRVLEMSTSKIPLEQCEVIFRRYYKGVLI